MMVSEVIPRHVLSMGKKMHLILKCYFFLRVHCTEQTPFMRVFPSGTHSIAEFTETMWTKYLVHEHNIHAAGA